VDVDVDRGGRRTTWGIGRGWRNRTGVTRARTKGRTEARARDGRDSSARDDDDEKKTRTKKTTGNDNGGVAVII